MRGSYVLFVALLFVLAFGVGFQPAWGQNGTGTSESNASLQEAIAPLTVAEMAFCYDVREHEPVGVNDTFPDTVGRVYCFTRLIGATEKTHVEHVWYYQQELARVKLRVESPNWRTWSSKRIMESQDGWWTVEVVDAEGNVLASRDFFISQTAQ